MTTQFKPSQVYKIFKGSALRNGEREAIASAVICILSVDDDWGSEIAGTDMSQPQCIPGLPDMYIAMFDMMPVPIVENLQGMIKEGYFEVLSESGAFKVTQQMIDFYSGFVQN